MKFLLVVSAVVAVVVAGPTRNRPINIPTVIDDFGTIHIGPGDGGGCGNIHLDPIEGGGSGPIHISPVDRDRLGHIHVGPAIIDGFEPPSVVPAIIDFPLPESAVTPTKPQQASHTPIVQIIVNVASPQDIDVPTNI